MTTDEKRLLVIILCLLPAIGILTGIVITQNRLTGEINQTPVENQTKTREVNVRETPTTPMYITYAEASRRMTTFVRREIRSNANVVNVYLNINRGIYHAQLMHSRTGQIIGWINLDSRSGKVIDAYIWRDIGTREYYDARGNKVIVGYWY